ncbi:MAG: DUF4363 family protein [Clostridia bacterium]|nr:DUF4363 family protein [Clostridia bacterium]
MKNRVIVGVLCLVLAILTAFYGYRRVGSAARALTDAASQALQSPDAAFEASAAAALRLWEENRAVFFAFVWRDAAEELDLRFETARAALSRGERALAKTALAEAGALLSVLARAEKPGIENIL